jgi:hypothetical protein
MAGEGVKANFGTLDQWLTPAAREAILRRIADAGMGRIKRRTGQGKDVDGAPFAPYSTRYAKQRRQAGRNDKPVTLLLSGAMLASMQVVQGGPDKVLLGFTGTAAATRFTKAVRPRKDRRTGAKITHSVSASTARVANALKAQWNDKGEGHNPRRHFFGLSQEDRRALTVDAIKQVIASVRDESLKAVAGASALRAARLGK